MKIRAEPVFGWIHPSHRTEPIKIESTEKYYNRCSRCGKFGSQKKLNILTLPCTYNYYKNTAIYPGFILRTEHETKL